MWKKLSYLACIIAVTSVSSQACTGITLKTENKEIIQARTIEWAGNNLNSSIIISPRGEKFQSPLPDKKLGLKWTSKYGFVGASVSHESIIGEGVNEVGLNAGVFYFLNYGQLAPYTGKNTEKTINDMDFVKWVLTSFKTVDEVKEAIYKIKIAPIIIENGVPSPTGHWRVTDASGKSIVIEIIKNGEIHIYENTVGVLTNSPGFDWHLTNLNNYVNLHTGGNKGFMLGDQKVFPAGAGSGFLGLPGDVTPPSRFIRAAFYANNTPPLKGNTEGINQAFHILNNFDIPIGISFNNKNDIPKDLPSATQWTTAINLNEHKFYYKTMNNQNIRMIDLNKIDFSKVKYQTMPLDKNNKQEIEELIIK